MNTYYPWFWIILLCYTLIGALSTCTLIATQVGPLDLLLLTIAYIMTCDLTWCVWKDGTL